MRLPFGLEIVRRQVTPTTPSSLYYDSGRSWMSVVREPFTGAWQRNYELRGETIASYHAVYACITLIASDIAKCRLKLVQEVEPEIWEEVRDINSPFLPVIRKPNGFQNRIQFFENWVTSKLINGNTYVLKERDARGVVVALYVLDPLRVKPLVTPDGEVYYELFRDNLAGLVQERTIVPGSEIIHDMTSFRHHPLCGIPPMAPAALAATHGLNIQQASITFFRNDSRPGGFLTAPGFINQETAARVKEQWETGFTGDNRGRVAVMGDGLEWKNMTQNAVDSQLLEQLGITGKMVCSSFNVPPYKVQVGDPPNYNNVGALNTQYYTDCLQKHFEAIELALDEGLGLTAVPGRLYGAEFDTDALLRMDGATMIKAMQDGVRGGFLAPNEARKKLGYRKTEGGDSPMMQHQDYSLAALAKRDAKADPFATAVPPQQQKPPSQNGEDDEENVQGDQEDEESTRMLVLMEMRQRLDLPAYAREIEASLAD